jgi:hypothetical protein
MKLPFTCRCALFSCDDGARILCSILSCLSSSPCHPRCRLGILFADLNINPSALASCVLSAHLYADFLCLLADPFGFADPPPGFPAVQQFVTGWLCLQPRPVSYRLCVLLSLPHLLLNLLHLMFHPLLYRHRYNLRQYAWSTCFCHFRPPGFPHCVPPATS